MASRRLYVFNGSTLIHDEDVRAMVRACNIQIRDHVAPAWGIDRVVVTFHSGTGLSSIQEAVPAGSWVIGVLDNPDQAGVLGWHSQDDQDRIYGEVFAQPSLEDGQSTATQGPYAVSATLSHEIIETFGDPLCTAWSDSGRGYLVATELCDPVEADGYPIDGVQVSNFVKPAWFDVLAPAGTSYDYLGKCKGPLSMTKGGYWVQMKDATETQKFGDVLNYFKDTGFDVRGSDDLQAVFSPEMPQWRRALKMGYGRNAIKRGVNS
jgi:hypothetical protein